ncbi:hypothetical protein PoB_002230200 [Plakobranchus ocellatus]|uniref:Uncharacterized protein n=1 Tax=Plakobranchus ocellatus TaxID=259542 RepID=A0AAV3ZMN9_9GAST|nr:hypothetical protein PoB_002230200 [Plakobranchus ocellatus]
MGRREERRRRSPPSGRGAGGGAQTRDTRIHVDLKADPLATVPPGDERAEVGRRGRSRRKDEDVTRREWG